MDFIYVKGQKLESNVYYLAENVLPFASPAPTDDHIYRNVFFLLFERSE